VRTSVRLCWKHRQYARATTPKLPNFAVPAIVLYKSHSTAVNGLLNPMVLKTQDSETANDRRSIPRFRVRAPLTVIAGDREIPAYTRDLSNKGVYFYLASDDGGLIDQDFEFLVELPPEITLSTFCRIRCHGRALRKEKAKMSLTGVAAEILDYSILKAAVSNA
jgi:PilZ domain